MESNCLSTGGWPRSSHLGKPFVDWLARRYADRAALDRAKQTGLTKGPEQQIPFRRNQEKPDPGGERRRRINISGLNAAPVSSAAPVLRRAPALAGTPASRSAVRDFGAHVRIPRSSQAGRRNDQKSCGASMRPEQRIACWIGRVGGDTRQGA